jgi:hypothetical protein
MPRPVLILAVLAAAASPWSLAGGTTAAALPPATATAPACGTATATAIELSWPPVDGSDLYYVAAFAPALDAELNRLGVADDLLRPFFIQTVDAAGGIATTTVGDLKPNASYVFRVRAHPASEPTISWGGGWGAFSDPVTCSTTPTVAAFPAPLSRVGAAASPNAVTISWTLDARAAAAGLRLDDGSAASGGGGGIALDVGVLRLGAAVASVEAGVAAAWRRSQAEHHAQVEWREVPLRGDAAQGGVTTVDNLPTDSAFLFITRAREAVETSASKPPGAGGYNSTRSSNNSNTSSTSTSTIVSDPVLFRTTAANVSYASMYRISEYSFDVDFLDNHDSASVEALPLYLMTCDPTGLCSPWNKTEFGPQGQWDACQAYMQTLCPRGEGFECLACADTYHDDIAKASWRLQGGREGGRRSSVVTLF